MATKKEPAASEVENAVVSFKQTLELAETQLSELRRLRSILSQTVETGADTLMKMAQNAPQAASVR